MDLPPHLVAHGSMITVGEVDDARNGFDPTKLLSDWDTGMVYPEIVGDCEDYALQKRKLLNEMGFPLGALLMTVGKDAKGGGHAVLTVVTDLGDFVLDNVEQRVLLWQDAELYYLKRQSQDDPNAWVSLVSG